MLSKVYLDVYFSVLLSTLMHFNAALENRLAKNRVRLVMGKVVQRTRNSYRDSNPRTHAY